VTSAFTADTAVQVAVSYTPKSIALLNEEEVAVGADNGHIHVYSLKASALTEVSILQQQLATT
jgi:uncharacterized protein (DUF849 family)